MTPTQLKYSRLMAEFMGEQLWNDGIIGHDKIADEIICSYPIQFNYHTSYDWLMPVWVKFRGLKFKKTSDQINYSHHHQHFVRLLNYGEIEQAFEALGKAIEWLNENKLL